MSTASELPIDTSASAMDMAQAMFGTGITIVSASYTGDAFSSGIYTDGLTVAPGVMPSDTGVILSTGYVSDFTNSSGDSNQKPGTSSDTAGVNNDPGLNAIAGTTTYDAAIFEASFIPDGSTLTMQIVFSSEEYLEFVGQGFNDAVGIWVNGEKAVLTVGDGDVSIDNINPNSNPNFYVDNADGAYNTEMDGFTVTLTLKAPVVPGEVNTIRIAIADGGDQWFDSNLLIAGNSIQTAVIAQDDSFTVQRWGETVVDLTANDTNVTGGTLTITKINGIAVTAGSIVTLASGVEVVVNGDGTITLIADGQDNLGPEGFTYEVSSADGITDVGFVSGQIVPCFVAGTRIDTARGSIPIEEIVVGDLVLTLDQGFQPVRWHGVRELNAPGRMAPVMIPAGSFGDHGALAVSPQHRLHFCGWQAELYAGEPEVLVKAIHLVRAGRLAQDPSGAAVAYHHLLFDSHQIVRAEGLWSESYLPGPATLPGHDAETQEELLALFPALARNPDLGYGPSARPEVPAHVAALIAA